MGEAKIEEEMKNQDQLKLKDNERKASQELKQKILERFLDAEIILYGSKENMIFEE